MPLSMDANMSREEMENQKKKTMAQFNKSITRRTRWSAFY